jgi:hypothetical protein
VGVEAWKDGRLLNTFFVKDGGHGSVVGESDDTTLEGLFGKDIARQIVASPKGTIEGDNLTIGGEGFKKVYDEYAKEAFRKIGSQFGSSVDNKMKFDLSNVKVHGKFTYSEAALAGIISACLKTVG